MDTERIRKIRLTIAYDGSGYAGWQIQKTGIGVQQRVCEAIGQLFERVPIVQGSSRTDAGVHSLGLSAHVDIPESQYVHRGMTVRKLRLALNAFLPADIRITQACEAAADFHARFDATGKEYRYQVWNHPSMNPLLLRRAWHVPPPLDVDSMRSAAGRFTGRKDFKSFAAHHAYEPKSTIRTMTRCVVRRSGSLLTFVLEGDGFLYKMCRGIVGTIVQVGLGRFTPNDVDSMFAKGDRRTAGMSAPACGLILWKVRYDKLMNENKTGP